MIYLILCGILIIYFLQKKEQISKYDCVFIILLFASYILFSNYFQENFNSSEAIQTLATLYQDGTLTVPSLNLTGNLTVAGNSQFANLNVSGDTKLANLGVANTITSSAMNCGYANIGQFFIQNGIVGKQQFSIINKNNTNGSKLVFQNDGNILARMCDSSMSDPFNLNAGSGSIFSVPSKWGTAKCPLKPLDGDPYWST